jgi:hypothetical protein
MKGLILKRVNLGNMRNGTLRSESRVFPNHHTGRIVRFEKMEKRNRPPGRIFTYRLQKLAVVVPVRSGAMEATERPVCGDLAYKVP